MTELTVLRQEAAAARAAAAGGQTAALGIPDQPQRDHVKFVSELRASKVKKDGQDWYQVEGYASVFETPYEMWDQFGPYMEVVSTGAADTTLSASPFVIFRWNHGGTAMANTRNGRLELSADDTGLHMRALLNPTRDDVKLLMQAMTDDDVSEQSFMFMIVRGMWSPDYSEYRIEEFDLDRGDVGPVQYGANPYTSIAARSGEILADLRRLPSLAAREAWQILNERQDVNETRAVLDQMVADAEDDDLYTRTDSPAPTTRTETEAERVQLKPLPKRQGRSVAMLRAMLNADDEL
jgi:HK97 family phage prohead protease